MLDKIDKDKLIELDEHLRSQPISEEKNGRSEATINHYFGLLKTFFNIYPEDPGILRSPGFHFPQPPAHGLDDHGLGGPGKGGRPGRRDEDPGPQPGRNDYEVSPCRLREDEDGHGGAGEENEKKRTRRYKMRKTFVCFLVLVLFISAQAQFKFNVEKEMKKGEAEIEIEGKTFDEVWKGVSRALMARKMQIKESDKESGIIYAQVRPGAFYVDGDVLTSWQLMIEEDEGKIKIYFRVSLGSDAISAKKPFKKFCEKLEEILEEKGL